TPEDLLVAEALLRARTRRPEAASAEEDDGASRAGGRERGEPTVRVGYGYDVHAFAAGRRLVLGGVEIPAERGLLGHSDADALLGAAGLGDIGRHFPDTDPAYKDASSVMLLQRVHGLLKKAGWRVGNVDATVVAEAPKLAPYIPDMVRCISETPEIPPTAVNVKATTSEKLGFVGAGQGVAVHAVATIYGGEAEPWPGRGGGAGSAGGPERPRTPGLRRACRASAVWPRAGSGRRRGRCALSGQ